LLVPAFNNGDAIGDTYISIENLEGSFFADQLIGNNANNTIDGVEGNDSLEGNGGTDILIGGEGADSLDGGDGEDFASYASNGGLTADLRNPGFNTFQAAGDTYTSIENIIGTDFGDTLRGDTGDNTLRGNGGNDTLNGAAGADLLEGGLGNDTYFVDTDFDRVRDPGTGGGYDKVFTSATFRLHQTLAFIEELRTTNNAATTAIDLFGSDSSNILEGNAGINTLDGRGGADVMSGLGGNDTYFVNNSGDRIVELAGKGTDNVRASLSYGLNAGIHVEVMQTLGGVSSTTAINLTGNEIVNSLVGNAAVNFLNGAGGADTMQGFAGNDTYFADSTGDRVLEAAGQGTDTVRASSSYALPTGSSVENLQTLGTTTTTAIDLYGNELGQTIIGNAASNIISGRLGTDTLVGAGGNDFFLFNTTLGASNIDSVADFNVPADTIRVDNAVFTTLALGTLTAAAFRIGTAAADASDRIIYNNGTGALIYDSNGNAAGGAIQFAKLGVGLALTNADFVVV
jgi:Ca2+-binding RTX toxin-like protein